MNEEINMEENKVLAESVSDNIKYEFFDYYLVKPLDPVKVMKKVSTPVSKGASEKDGVKAEDYSEVKTEVVEMDSDFTKAVVLKLPTNYQAYNTEEGDAKNISNIQIGDIVVYRATAGMYFDLVKDSKLVKHWDIIAKING